MQENMIRQRCQGTYMATYSDQVPAGLGITSVSSGSGFARIIRNGHRGQGRQSRLITVPCIVQVDATSLERIVLLLSIDVQRDHPTGQQEICFAPWVRFGDANFYGIKPFCR